MMMLDVINVHFDYADRPLLNNVNFSLNAGCLLHLRGDNGVGKTTLLKLLAGLIQPELGEIRYQGLSIADDMQSYLQSICYVGHKSGISQLLTVRESCQFDVHNGNDSATFDGLIKRFGLLGLEHDLCGLLSAGQRRRVGLLRLLMSNASLWLLDEPLVALDHHSQTILIDCFREHLEKGGQIILTSHQPIPNIDCFSHKDYSL